MAIYLYKYKCQTCLAPKQILFDSEREGRQPTSTDLPDSCPCYAEGCDGTMLNVYNEDPDIQEPQKLHGRDYLNTPMLVLMGHPDFSPHALRVMDRISKMTTEEIEKINLIQGEN